MSNQTPKQRYAIGDRVICPGELAGVVLYAGLKNVTSYTKKVSPNSASYSREWYYRVIMDAEESTRRIMNDDPTPSVFELFDQADYLLAKAKHLVVMEAMEEELEPLRHANDTQEGDTK